MACIDGGDMAGSPSSSAGTDTRAGAGAGTRAGVRTGTEMGALSFRWLDLVRRHPCLCVALTFYWTWFVVTLLGPLRLPFYDHIGLPLPSWCLLLLAQSAVFAVVFCSRRHGDRLLGSDLAIAVACAAFLLGIAISTHWLYLPLEEGASLAVYIVGALAMGYGSAVVLLRLLVLYARISLPIVLAHGSFAMLAAMALQLVSAGFVLPWVVMIPSLCCPAVIWFCLRRGAASLSEGRIRPGDDSDAPAFPVKGLITLLIQGVSFGFGLGLLQFWGDEFVPSRVGGAFSSAVASLILILVAFRFKADFSRLVYFVGFPLMAAGFLMMSISDGLLSVGNVIQASGFCYQFMLSLCLLVYLSRVMGIPMIACGSVGVFCTTFGLVVGGCLGAFAVSTDLMDTVGIKGLASCMGFALLLVALYASGRSTLEQTWCAGSPGVFCDELDVLGGKARSLAASRNLTPRETEVLTLAAHGRNRRSIASALCISEETAKAHLKSVYAKIGVHTQQELIDAVESADG